LTSRQGKILLDNIMTFIFSVTARNLNCKGNWGIFDKRISAISVTGIKS